MLQSFLNLCHRLHGELLRAGVWPQWLRGLHPIPCDAGLHLFADAGLGDDRWLKESRPYHPCGRRKLNTPCHCKHLKNEPEDGRLVAWDQLQLSLELENGVWIWRGKETWPQSLSVLHQQLKELSFLFTQIHHKHTRLIHFWLHAWLSGHVQMFDDFFTSWLTRLLKIIL